MVVEQKDKRDAEARDTQVGSLFKKMQTNTLHFVGATSASACGNVMNSAEVDKIRQTRNSAIKQIFFSTYECMCLETENCSANLALRLALRTF